MNTAKKNWINMCVEKTNGPVAKLKFDPPQFLETNR